LIVDDLTQLTRADIDGLGRLASLAAERLRLADQRDHVDSARRSRT
jgi:hypothetical protein